MEMSGSLYYLDLFGILTISAVSIYFKLFWIIRSQRIQQSIVYGCSWWLSFQCASSISSLCLCGYVWLFVACIRHLNKQIPRMFTVRRKSGSICSGLRLACQRCQEDCGPIGDPSW